MAIILDPARVWSDYGVVDLDKQSLVCRCSSEMEADRIADALIEADERRREAPKALLAQGGAS